MAHRDGKAANAAYLLKPLVALGAGRPLNQLTQMWTWRPPQAAAPLTKTRGRMPGAGAEAAVKNSRNHPASSGSQRSTGHVGWTAPAWTHGYIAELASIHQRPSHENSIWVNLSMSQPPDQAVQTN